jgi:hypothetical protein
MDHKGDALMILSDGSQVTRDAGGSVKYGCDGMAEYLDVLAGIGGEDMGSGSVDSPTGWFCLFGKRILRGDDQGFVWVERYKRSSNAMLAFCELEDEYNDWTHDVLCVECDTAFNSEEGSCWCCGARNYVERPW